MAKRNFILVLYVNLNTLLMSRWKTEIIQQKFIFLFGGGEGGGIHPMQG